MSKKDKKNKAQAMIVVFIYISIVSLIGIYLMLLASNLHEQVIRQINHSRGFYAAEASLINAFLRRSGGTTWGSSVMTFPATSDTSGAGGGGITVNIIRTNIGNGVTRLRAIAQSWHTF